MLRKKKQCIAIIYYKWKLNLFGRNDTKQAKSLIFIVVPQAEQVPKVQTNKKKKKEAKRDVILLWNKIAMTIIIMTIMIAIIVLLTEICYQPL